MLLALVYRPVDFTLRLATMNVFRPHGSLQLLALGIGLASCSILDPVPPPPLVTVFPGGWAASAAASAASASLRSAKDAKCDLSSPGPSCFAGGLGQAIDLADERRVQMVVRAREVSNGNAAFNAIQYPLGAAAVYEKMRGAPNHNFLLPAALAAGIYGFVNSGVVDRERHYLREAFELHCAIARISPYLYFDKDINDSPAAGTTTISTMAVSAAAGMAPGRSNHKPGRPDKPSGNSSSNAAASAFAATTSTTITTTPAQPNLLSLIDGLKAAIEAFRSERIKTSFLLDGRAGSGGLPSDVRERRVAQASGRGGATPGNDKSQAVRDRWNRQAALANDLLTRLVSLRAQINGSGGKLNREIIDIAGQAQDMLSARVPLPQNPRDTITATKPLQTSLVAQSGAVSDQEMDPALPKDLMDGLSPTAKGKAKDFAETQGMKLQSAYEAANAWAAKHDDRVRSSATETAELKCQTRLAPVAPRAPASTPTSSTKPSTDNTGAGTGDGNNGGQSALPNS